MHITVQWNMVTRGAMYMYITLWYNFRGHPENVRFTVPPGNNFPIIPEYSEIFTNIHKYSHIFTYIFEYFSIYLNTLEDFVTFWYILEYSRIKWNDNDLGYSIISWSILEYSQIFTNIHKYSQIFTLKVVLGRYCMQFCQNIDGFRQNDSQGF